jgi:hypothetical protein
MGSHQICVALQCDNFVITAAFNSYVLLVDLLLHLLQFYIET